MIVQQHLQDNRYELVEVEAVDMEEKVLCECGCGQLLPRFQQLKSGYVYERKYLRNHHRRGKTFGCFRGQHLARVTAPTNYQIILTAGWFEGEGYCGNGEVQIAQKDHWMVDRLVEWFGGKVYTREDPPKPPWNSKGPIHDWCATGPRARGVLDDHLHVSFTMATRTGTEVPSISSIQVSSKGIIGCERTNHPGT